MILPALAPFILMLGSAQYVPTNPHAVTSGGGGCAGITGTFTDCFTYTENPISNGGKWTANSGCGAAFGNVSAAGAGAVSTGGTAGISCAVLTAFTNASPSARVTVTTTGTLGNSGPCVWQDTAGNGYCWLLGNGLFKITAGSGSALTPSCPSVTGGAGTDVFEISLVSANTYRCTDVTAGTHGTDVTDSTFTVNKGGFLVDLSSGTVTITRFGWL